MTNGSVSLAGSALGVLAYLHHLHRATGRFSLSSTAIVKVGQKGLMKRTGLSRRTVGTAIKTLKDSGYIGVEPDRKGSRKNGSGVARYILTNPDTREALWNTGRNVLYGNQIKYFTMPSAVVTKTEAIWSIASLTASEIELYTAILWLATIEGSIEFHRTPLQLRKASGLGLATFRKALESIRNLGMVNVTGDEKEGLEEFTIRLCDPYTGEPPHTPDGEDRDDPANWYTTNGKSVTRRLNLNTGNPDEVERLIRASVPHGDPILEHGDGDLMIRCPFHVDGTPSCSVSPVKRCFYCFGCGERGTLTKLIATLTGGSKSDAIQRIAGATGQKAEFHEPDKSVIAKYDYLDAKGTLKKQVLRYQNDESGKKVMRQRRPVAGGWIWNAKGVKPLLYHGELMEYARIICIVEGEKDADTVTNLHQEGCQIGNPMIGVTSGGAGSWDASFAKLLKGHGSIVIIPDADEPGAAFAEAVAVSLVAEGIEYRTISLPDGCKDATEFMEGHPAGDLIYLIENGRLPPTDMDYSYDGGLDGEITI